MHLHSPVTDYWSNKNIVDLTSDLDSTVKSKVLDSVAAEGYRDDKLVAVPVGQVQPAILWTNKAVLKEAGISDAPTTWDGLLDDVAKLKDAGKTPIALAGEESQKTAINYLKENTYSDGIVDGLLKSGGVPPVKGIEDKVKSADDGSGFLTYVYDAVKGASNYQLSLDVALPADQGQALLNNLEQVFLKQITPQQFADAMNKTL